MNTITCRSFNRGYSGVVINILKFTIHLVVGSAVTAGDVAANHRLATASEIPYALAEFTNEINNVNHEFHDFRNIFHAQMKAVAKRNCINITEKE